MSKGYPTVSNSVKGHRVGRQSVSAATQRSEAGIGAMMPWADRLYYTTYLADHDDGSGGDLRYLTDSGQDVLVDRHDSCHAGRMVHKETNQLLIGEYLIALDGTVSKVAALNKKRVTAWARHMTAWTTKAYALTMQGILWEVDLISGVATQLADVTAEFGLGSKVHFKAAWTIFKAADIAGGPYANTRLFLASNSQYAPSDAAQSGVLLRWDGTTFTSCGRESFIEVAGNYDPGSGCIAHAVGMDHKSPFFLTPSPSLGGTYRKFRFPFGSDMQRYFITQEWMRMRPVQTERLFLNAYGTFFNVSPWMAHISADGTENYGDIAADYPRVEAVGKYTDTITDFCVWNGHMWLGTNNQSEQRGYWPTAGQSQSCLKSVDIDDLSMRKATGRGYLWYKEAVVNGTASDPMLMRGYDKKTIFIKNDTATACTVTLTLIDYSDSHPYSTTIATVPNGLATLTLPDGLECDWFRLTPSANVATMSAWVNYR